MTAIKIFYTVAVAFVMLILGGPLILAALIFGANIFIKILLTGVSTLPFLFLIACIWGWFGFKKRMILFGSLAGIIVACFIGAASYDAYHAGFEEVGEQGVNLELYQPFREDTKAVSLNEASTLSLDGDLPRLDGATALYPLYSAFARAVYPEDNSRIGKKLMTLTVPCYAPIPPGRTRVL